MNRILIILACMALLMQATIAQDKLTENDYLNTSHSSSALIAPIVTDRIIWSEIINDNFKIFISLPPDYDSLRFPKYPVVYFLDGGGGSFHTIISEYMEQELIPEVITIGIGYPGSSQRNRDYTYGFMNFYQFMKQELIPQMEKEFNIDPDNRTLFGHSYGGICALFTMFQYTDFEDILFHNLIAASPSIWYPDGRLAYTREQELYNQTHILPVNLYMSVGSMEGSMITDLNTMQQVLIGHNYQYFNLSCHIYEGKDHSTNKEITFREGIQWVLHQEIKIPTHTIPDELSAGQIASSLYPNPAIEKLNLVVSSPLNNRAISCRITDINGRDVKLVHEVLNAQQLLQIPIGELPKGIYVLQLSNGLKRQTMKFVK